MKKITYKEKIFNSRPDEKILQSFLRQEQDIKHSCGKGTCKVCKMKVIEGEIPEGSQKGLDKDLCDQGIILPCITIPNSDMHLTDYEKSEQQSESFYEFNPEPSKDYPDPVPELWERLENGDLLTEILTDFYGEVFEDERLSPFFQTFTKDRAIQKVWNFMKEILTGEPVFFGLNPRNSHHWMVISDELFDYREELFERHLINHGIEKEWRVKWREINEYFRSRIVKTRQWPKIVNGEKLPLEGYGEIHVDIGMICDGCSELIDEGTNAKYHLFTGQVYCHKCHASKSD